MVAFEDRLRLFRFANDMHAWSRTRGAVKHSNKTVRTMYLSIIAVGVGGGLGSLLRWALGLRLNAVFPNLPLGTFSANVIAGYIIGVAVAFFARYPDMAMQWRLFVITGLMGGLSTFSTFSAEVVAHVRQKRLGWAAIEIVLHVGASLAMTALGIATVARFA
jgi:fluoride exporter